MIDSINPMVNYFDDVVGGLVSTLKSRGLIKRQALACNSDNGRLEYPRGIFEEILLFLVVIYQRLCMRIKHIVTSILLTVMELWPSRCGRY